MAVVNYYVTADASQAVCVEQVQHRVVERMPAVDEDEIEASGFGPKQVRESEFRWLRYEAEEIYSSSLEMSDSHAVPVIHLLWINDYMRCIRATPQPFAYVQGGKAMGAANLKGFSDLVI